MNCVCTQKLQGSVDLYASMPLDDLAASVPSDLSALSIQSSIVSLMGASGLSGGGSSSASASASGSASAAASSTASASASATANAQALLGSYTSLGIDPLDVNASAAMSQSVQSMNTNLPSAVAELSALFGPLANPLATISAALSASSLVQTLFGFSLTHPDASSMLSSAASSSVSASSSVQASSSSEAMASLASDLGYDLSTQSGCDGFSAMLSGVASFDGAVDLPVTALGSTTGTVGLLQAVGTIGVDLTAPNATDLIASVMPALFSSLSVFVGLSFPSASASSESSVSASAAASASSSTNAGGSVAYSVTPELTLPEIADPTQLSLAANLSSQLGANVSDLAGCPVCPLVAAAV